MKWVRVMPWLWGVMLVWSLVQTVAGMGWPWVSWVTGVAAMANIFLWREGRIRDAYRATQEDLRHLADKYAHSGLAGYDEAGNRVPDVTALKQVAWCGKPGVHEQHNWNYQLSAAVDQYGASLLVNHYDLCPGHPDRFDGISEVEAFLQEG